MIPSKNIQIGSTEAIILGNASKNVFLYVHGQNGNKEEAHNIEKIVCRYNYQILSLDLPSIGDPWIVIPELINVIDFVKKKWDRISILANSIGAWFSMLSYENENIDDCFFVSPVLDMKALISKMMKWANVSEEQLQQKQIIHTDFGQTLSWKYWEYVLSHTISNWKFQTKILYGEKDNLIDYDVVESFAQKFHCDLTIMANGEHWFHTNEQLEFMQNWLDNGLKNMHSL